MGIFSSKHEEPNRVSMQDKAILKLKVQRDKLQQYKRKIQAVLDKEDQLARQAVREGKKDKALVLLKKKRYQTNLLVKTEGQLENLEQVTQSIEFQQMEKSVVEGLEAGNLALKELQQELSIEKVEQLMDETREGIEYANEVSEILAGKLTPEDDTAIEAEFAAITGIGQEEDADDIQLPDVPTQEPVGTPATAEPAPASQKTKAEPQLVPA
eukprot:m.153387 g.153387  ORF g.153387 m.153387 type:complete len:212 (+) comp17471_c1_seq2:2127-2762(+)